ncbi:antibiotic biosynthesis monooxygenase family protein [Cytobacillus purgationiresistens]|uniref:Heme-degrading monooxygenase HmoA n=1 Tax=Cytobacillus purgationiresistens TaxID=863449 RepID=A0ABU0AC83_9BACI|nr:antibiotic biosynthesis monooxygenase [Cytobacillus purgationiresistens]MDQ0268847.1 heme-degrading monooxygenase HmoA [Cytobacillus purgationiresistens]
MNLYITSGTRNFLSIIKQKHTKKPMVMMQNAQDTLLVHETPGKSIFQQPRSFKIINSEGTLRNGGFAVFNYIPLTDEAKPIFEYNNKNLSEKLAHLSGLQAVRVLEPLKTNTFLILTIWDKETHFKDWEATDAYKDMQSGTEYTQLLSSPAYAAKYYIQKDEE